ncbi:NAD-dependent epimerase/dehydratase family protein [Lacimicrobium sp. SS2-24]|uniref:NAD-dependent epimerase/dehydratase family protein n=1 Tax=Lacimicrobium sp. SS2-24 TaxID=2005569 RepID=UPI000B4AD7DE|nr:NAD-dependent epimerase/dehydratase family protein [Lacimicrobium sp. SS2-24]
MTNISILGCGWLGQPLAVSLLAQGFDVAGTCRSEQKQNALRNLGINAHQFELGKQIPANIWHKTTLILNLPPGRYREHSEFFTREILGLIDFGIENGCENLLFISTTSVYGDRRGRVTEQSPVNPITPSAKAHIRIEQEILKQGGTVLRLAGLIGPQRHPVKHLAGRDQLSGGANPVNLIHQQDVINAVLRIIRKEYWGKVCHLAATEHPSRADFYIWAAEKAGLPAPQFLPDTDSDGKIIDASATLQALGLELTYPSPFSMPVS